MTDIDIHTNAGDLELARNIIHQAGEIKNGRYRLDLPEGVDTVRIIGMLGWMAFAFADAWALHRHGDTPTADVIDVSIDAFVAASPGLHLVVEPTPDEPA